jgi:hypothetical protein
MNDDARNHEREDCINTVNLGISYLHHGHRWIESINSADFDLNANIL